MGWPARAGTDRPARVESTSGRRAAGGGNPMPRLLKSALTLGLMGVPVWVAIVGAFSSGGADPATLVVRVGGGGGTTVWVDGERFEARSAEVGPVPVSAGSHRVRVMAGGFPVFDRTVALEPNVRVVVDARPRDQAQAVVDEGPGDDDGIGDGGHVVRTEGGTLAEGPAAGLALDAHRTAVTAVASACQGRALVTVGGDGMLSVWDPATGRLSRSFAAHQGRAVGLVVLGDGRRALSAGHDGRLRLWDLETSACLLDLATRSDQLPACLAVTPDGRTAALGGEGGRVQVFDLATGRETRRRELTHSVPGGLGLSPDGRRLLVGQVGAPETDQPVLVWDLEANRDLAPLVGHRRHVRGVAFLPDGHRALTGGADQTLRLWDVDSGRELKRFEGHPGVVSGLAVSADGRFALAGTGHVWANGWVAAETYGAQVWDLERGRPVGRFATPGPIGCVAFSADGRQVITGGDDRKVRAWDLATGPRVAGHLATQSLADPRVSPAS